MKNVFALFLTLTCSMFLFACEESDKIDRDGISITLDVPNEVIAASVNWFAGPVSDEEAEQVGVGLCTGNGWLCVRQISITSQSLPGIFVSESLSDVELQSLEIIYSRADLGTRVPPPLVRRLTGRVETAAAFAALDYPIITEEQTFNEPMSDLLFENGGIDRETGEERIKLNLTLRAFGRTIGGNDVETRPVAFTLDLHQ